MDYLKDDVSTEVKNNCEQEKSDFIVQIEDDSEISRDSCSNDLTEKVLKKVNYCTECKNDFADISCKTSVSLLTKLAFTLIKKLSCNSNLKKVISYYLKKSSVSMQWKTCFLHYNVIGDILISQIISKVIFLWCRINNQKKSDVVLQEEALKLMNKETTKTKKQEKGKKRKRSCK